MQQAAVITTALSIDCSPFALEDGVGARSELLGRRAALGRLVGGVFGASARLDLKELLHLEKTLCIVLICSRFCHRCLINIRGGHGSGAGVGLGRIQH